MTDRLKLANFVGGISLQPSTFKEAYRPDDQVNMIPHPIYGLMDRPGTEFVSVLSSTTGPSTRWHFATSRDTERYIMAVRADGIRVWDLEGNEFPVLAPGGYSYLQTRTPGNFLLSPEDFTNAAWTKTGTGTVVAPANADGPYGTLAVNQITGVTATATCFLTQTPSAAIDYEASTSYTFSVHVRAPTTSASLAHAVQLDFFDAGAGSAGWDFYYSAAGWTSGNAQGSQAVQVRNAKIVDLGNRWARLEVTIEAGGTLLSPDVKVRLALTSAAAGGTQWAVWGARGETDVLEAKPYISEPTNSYELLTLRDFTYVLNKNTPVLMSGTTSPAKPSPQTFYLWVRQGLPKTTYTVQGTTTGIVSSFAGDVLTYQPGQGTSAGESAVIKTDDIAELLKTDLDGDAPIATCTRKGGLLRVPLNSGYTINALNVTDSNGDQALVLIFEAVPGLIDLPTRFFNGVKVKIAENTDADTPGYFVEAVVKNPDTDGYGEVEWVESMAFSLPTTINSATMPHGLTRKQDDASGTATGSAYKVYFEFAPITWDTRNVGDETTNPIPSFVGTATAPRTITNMAFVQNRLVFLSGDDIVMSENGRFTNFFRTTVVDVPEGDPIDISLAYPGVVTYDAVIQVNNRVFVRSSDVLIEVIGEPFFTPNQVRSEVIVELDSDPQIHPLVIGNRVVMTDRSGRYTRVRELVPSGDGQTFIPIDTTTEVSSLIQLPIYEIAASEQNNLLALIPRADDAGVAQPTLFMQSFLLAGNERLQTAWWKFSSCPGDTIRYAGFDENEMFLVVERAGQATLERWTVDPERQLGIDFLPIADGLLHTSSGLLTSSFGSGDTEFQLPYDTGTEEYVFIHDGAGATARGTVVEASSNTADTVVFEDVDLTTATGWIGRKMSRSFVFPEVRPKETSNVRGRHATTLSSVQLYHLELDYRDTGALRVKVTIPSNLNSPYTYTVERATLGDGRLRVPCRAVSTEPRVEINSDGATYLARPCTLTSGEWFLSVRRRGRASLN